MADAINPEKLQKPSIGSVLGEPPVDSTQPSLQSNTSKPPSLHSEDSFVSVSEYLPEPSLETSATSVSSPLEQIESPEQELPHHGPLKTPLTRPSPKTKPNPPAELSPEQQAKYAQVLATVSTWKTVPTTTTKVATSAEITEDERMWLSRECLLRYLRATKWKVPDALKRLQGTLSWRREYGADTFSADYISPENETGKQVILGYDIDARPCLYLNPGKQNTKMSDRQIHHLSYMLDRVIDMMGPGQETTALLINFKGASSGSTPSVGQAKQVLNILQGHNPERLGRALISERKSTTPPYIVSHTDVSCLVPWYVSTFFRLISPLIDPVTRDKMKFNEDLRNWVPPEQLQKSSGGDLDFEYDHAAYWPALTKECQKRQAAYKARWVAAGKRTGEYEEYLRGGRQKSISATLDEVERTTNGVQINGTKVDIGALEV